MEVRQFLGIFFDLFKLDGTYASKTEAELQELLKTQSNITRILKNNMQTGCTNGNGQIKFENLEAGVYLLRETDNEDKKGSYKYSSRGDTQGYSMEIGKIKKVELGYSNFNVSVKFYDEGYGGLKIQKVSKYRSSFK